jgi:hypothetical protein
MLTTVKSCSISRDSETDTLGSATLDVHDLFGECYVRIYLITIQNGVRERHPLGTYLVQTPSSSFDGKVKTVTMDAYTPLLELKESQPPIGYFLKEGSNMLEEASRLTALYTRAPVVSSIGTGTNSTLYSNFVSNTDDTWFTFIRDLLSNANHEFILDENGKVLFAPIQELDTLQPVWTYNDDDKSILYTEISVDHDLYEIPNVVEVIYSTATTSHVSVVKNEDPNSPTSIQSRGREIPYRVTNPDLVGANPTDPMIDEYARKLLKSMSTLQYTVSYTHAYCPVRLGDCVRLNYSKAGITNIKAKVISQSIKCEPGCPVQEKAVFTTELWEG